MNAPRMDEKAREQFYLSNWLAAHPRLTCVLVCALCLIPMFLETPR